MRHVEGKAGAAGIQVEKREAAGEEVAKDHPLGEAGREAKADASRQLIQKLADVALIAGIEAGKPVTHDDPLDRTPVGKRPALALLPDRFGIDAGSEDSLAFPVEAGE